MINENILVVSAEKVNDEFGNVKEIGTRYSSKLCKWGPFNQLSFRLLTCEYIRNILEECLHEF